MTKRGNSQRRQMFGAHIAGLRRRTGRTQRQTARLLWVLSGRRWHVTRFKVSLWEYGARIPSEVLPAYAQALNVTYEDLMRAAERFHAPLGGTVQEYQRKTTKNMKYRTHTRKPGAAGGRRRARL